MKLNEEEDKKIPHFEIKTEKNRFKPQLKIGENHLEFDLNRLFLEQFLIFNVFFSEIVFALCCHSQCC